VRFSHRKTGSGARIRYFQIARIDDLPRTFSTVFHEKSAFYLFHFDFGSTGIFVALINGEDQ
jgi:hypothetical protein